MNGRAAAVLVAVALDALLGEPPAGAHPVVAAGRYLAAAERQVAAGPPRAARRRGAAAWAVGASGAAVIGAGWQAACRRLPRRWQPVAAGLALWPLLSARMLLTEVAAVERALAAGDDAGRAAVARVVSRDTSALDATGVRAAALQSLSENLSDSVVAPVFWYAVGGLPGAAAYRFINTADACWGYRTDRWRHAGTAAARADDVANLLPARLTAALLMAGARRPQWRALREEAGRTSSPNAGWPMAALALRLDCRLTKPGAYDLNPAGSHPEPTDTARALRMAGGAAGAAVAAAAAALMTAAALGRRP